MNSPDNACSGMFETRDACQPFKLHLNHPSLPNPSESKLLRMARGFAFPTTYSHERGRSRQFLPVGHMPHCPQAISSGNSDDLKRFYRLTSLSSTPLSLMAPHISIDVAALIGFVSEAVLYGAVLPLCASGKLIAWLAVQVSMSFYFLHL